MKRLLLSSVAGLALGGFVYAQSGIAVKDAVEAGIQKLNDDGANITFENSTVGGDNSLTLNGVRIAPEDGDIVITAEWMKLAPSTDVAGDVAITFSPVVEAVVTPDDETPPVTLQLASDDLVVTTNWVLDAAGKPSFSVTAGAMTLTGGSADHPILKGLVFAPRDLALSVAVEEDAGNVDVGMSVSGLSLDYAIGDPDLGSTVTTQAETEEWTVTFVGRGLPQDDDPPGAFIENGGSFRFMTAGGASRTSFSSDQPDMPISMEGTNGPGSAEVALENGEFIYRAQTSALDYTVTPNPEVMPMPPMSFALADGSIDIAMPVSASDETRAAKIGLALRELTVSDEAWSMFDPGAQIPRDPATLEIDMTAILVLQRPLTEAPMTDSPLELGELQNLTLNRAYLTIGGASVDAAGDVAIDNSIGFPMPDGAVDISVKGVQGLVQTLMGMGLVPQQQGGMALGMLMAFGQPTGEPDSFTTKIEFKDGGILANGQPIQ